MHADEAVRVGPGDIARRVQGGERVAVDEHAPLPVDGGRIDGFRRQFVRRGGERLVNRCAASRELHRLEHAPAHLDFEPPVSHGGPVGRIEPEVEQFHLTGLGLAVAVAVAPGEAELFQPAVPGQPAQRRIVGQRPPAVGVAHDGERHDAVLAELADQQQGAAFAPRVGDHVLPVVEVDRLVGALRLPVVRVKAFWPAASSRSRPPGVPSGSRIERLRIRFSAHRPLR